jgi:hypothetical protein
MPITSGQIHSPRSKGVKMKRQPSRYSTSLGSLLRSLGLCQHERFVVKCIDEAEPYKFCLDCGANIPIPRILTEITGIYLEVGRKQTFQLKVRKYFEFLETLLMK